MTISCITAIWKSSYTITFFDIQSVIHVKCVYSYSYKHIWRKLRIILGRNCAAACSNVIYWNIWDNCGRLEWCEFESQLHGGRGQWAAAVLSVAVEQELFGCWEKWTVSTERKQLAGSITLSSFSLQPLLECLFWLWGPSEAVAMHGSKVVCSHWHWKQKGNPKILLYFWYVCLEITPICPILMSKRFLSIELVKLISAAINGELY